VSPELFQGAPWDLSWVDTPGVANPNGEKGRHTCQVDQETIYFCQITLHQQHFHNFVADEGNTS
jgi:hypothetical protein